MDAVLLNWQGGEHEFALRLGELRKMQDACNAGPHEVFDRLRNQTYKIDDIIEPIRLGLIGAGSVESKDAGKLVIQMWEQVGAEYLRLTAMTVLARSLYGPEDDLPGEDQGVMPAPQENGDLAQSTEAEAP